MSFSQSRGTREGREAEGEIGDNIFRPPSSPSFTKGWEGAKMASPEIFIIFNSATRLDVLCIPPPCPCPWNSRTQNPRETFIHSFIHYRYARIIIIIIIIVFSFLYQ